MQQNPEDSPQYIAPKEAPRDLDLSKLALQVTELTSALLSEYNAHEHLNLLTDIEKLGLTSSDPTDSQKLLEIILFQEFPQFNAEYQFALMQAACQITCNHAQATNPRSALLKDFDHT